MGRISINSVLQYPVSFDVRGTPRRVFDMPLTDVDRLILGGAVDVYYNTRTRELNPVYEVETNIPNSGRVSHAT